jgi:hypothetical protein
MSDRYTKAVLTIIAAALVGLVLQNAISSVRARDDIQKVFICGYEQRTSDAKCANVRNIGNVSDAYALEVTK